MPPLQTPKPNCLRKISAHTHAVLMAESRLSTSGRELASSLSRNYLLRKVWNDEIQMVVSVRYGAQSEQNLYHQAIPHDTLFRRWLVVHE